MKGFSLLLVFTVLGVCSGTPKPDSSVNTQFAFAFLNGDSALVLENGPNQEKARLCYKAQAEPRAHEFRGSPTTIDWSFKGGDFTHECKACANGCVDVPAGDALYKKVLGFEPFTDAQLSVGQRNAVNVPRMELFTTKAVNKTCFTVSDVKLQEGEGGYEYRMAFHHVLSPGENFLMLCVNPHDDDQANAAYWSIGPQAQAKPWLSADPENSFKTQLPIGCSKLDKSIAEHKNLLDLSAGVFLNGKILWVANGQAGGVYVPLKGKGFTKALKKGGP